MHPILSELAISNLSVDAEAELAARQRLHLSTIVAGRADAPGLRFSVGSAIANAVRQFLNPRRYALDALNARERARATTRTTQVQRVSPPLIALPDRRPTPASDLPLAA